MVTGVRAVLGTVGLFFNQNTKVLRLYQKIARTKKELHGEGEERRGEEGQHPTRVYSFTKE